MLYMVASKEGFMSNGTYAGDVTPRQAWEILEKEPGAVLIDVRTDAEWSYVGVPDLRALGKEAQLIPWKLFPSGQVNPAFTDQLLALGIPRDDAVLFLCRSGVRSIAAAQAAAAAGYARAINVAEGFEGDKDAQGHRGTVGGWKVAGLPWGQG